MMDGLIVKIEKVSISLRVLFILMVKSKIVSSCNSATDNVD